MATRSRLPRVLCAAWSFLASPRASLAVARCAALLGFLGSQVRDERRWLSLARWAAQHPGTGRLGYVEPGHRERWLLIELRE